ncbi:hypothetical protein [Rhizobium sp. BE258]|uniref:hypothetical protein n=1 Tax=Rhizobium sp. BE258 TaxID=2817722 RepID=UPI00285B208F|nr:hypothetical protein [Rhizobium sp. BE258]MDR7145230.1 hypothetical protein [Rhizobium sp. BE258]
MTEKTKTLAGMPDNATASEQPRIEPLVGTIEVSETKTDTEAPRPRGEIDAPVEHTNETFPDDHPSLEALREASRQHTDAFVVATDLEDADQREASPGTSEQP